tara:strand:- start:296 stop:1666 length:1371 start_codon:yes stop_codon:yes gene_type:complete
VHYAIIDIETTGGSPKNSKITEIAIYKHDGEKIIDEYQTLIDPEMLIPPFIVQLTGISDKMVSEAPKFFEVAKKIIEFTEGCIFVAHNVGFDYGIMRIEFKTLGYDYRLPHLCTVRTSRYVLPGKDSYSLGKLTRSLGIQLVGRHRAGGDAFATAQLFTLLMKTDPNNLENFVQEELNPKRLHPNLNLATLEEIPNKTGVYRFFNDTNQLIYIGKSIHIKKRIEQHLRNNKTLKAVKMQKEISRIEFELTGSELLSLLKESILIKEHQPIYNRTLRRNSFPYGLFNYTDGDNYLRLFIAKVSTTNEIPISSFNTKREGVAFLERKVEEFDICTKLCDLYKTKSSCFQYTIKNCLGACIKEEPFESYNSRCQNLINELTMSGSSFYVLDKGRQRGEKSMVFVKNGAIRAMGYAPYHYKKLKPERWVEFLDIIQDDRDARTILKLFLSKSEKHGIVKV